jgi:hypothetical protein
MPRFEVYSASSLVGWTELELGDAPMGVAFGRLLPAPAYAAIQPVVLAAATGPLPDELQLSIREVNGAALQASGGVHLVDRSTEVGTDGMEVSILGVSYPSYDELFPEHVAAYERQFPHAG